MKAVLVAQIRKSLKLFFKNKIVRIVALSLAIFIVVGLILFFVPKLIISVILLAYGGAPNFADKALTIAVLLLNAILYPIYLLESVKAYNKYEKIKSQRKNDKTFKKSNLRQLFEIFKSGQ
jgi:E3 ubiquitin-protein ligase DOA10